MGSETKVVRASDFLDFAKNAVKAIEGLMPEHPSAPQAAALAYLQEYVRKLQKSSE
jgi:hypothetical protein